LDVATAKAIAGISPARVRGISVVLQGVQAHR